MVDNTRCGGFAKFDTLRFYGFNNQDLPKSDLQKQHLDLEMDKNKPIDKQLCIHLPARDMEKICSLFTQLTDLHH
jgi:hypothetical protein